MVYLTFIRYAEVKADGCISVKDAKMLFLLAKNIVEKFGKPQMLYAAGDDGGTAVCSNSQPCLYGTRHP